MKAGVCILLLAVVSLSTIGEDVKPVWLSTLPEPEPVNVSALPVVIPRPVVAGNVSPPVVDIRDIPVFVDPDLVEYTMAKLRGEDPFWLTFSSDPFEGWPE